MLNKILVCQLLIVGICFAIPATKDSTKKVQQQAAKEATTRSPPKAAKETNVKSAGEKEPTLDSVDLPRVASRKRGIPDALLDKPSEYYSNSDDLDADIKTAEEYAKALGADPEGLQSGVKTENTVLKAESYSDPVGMSGFQYYGTDNRRKRTAVLEELLSAPGTRPKRELELTPDDVLALLALWEEQKHYSTPLRNRWSGQENTLELPNEEADDVANDVYEDQGLASQQNFERRPYRWNDFGKRFMVSRRRRSSFLTNPTLKVPLYRRAVL